MKYLFIGGVAILTAVLEAGKVVPTLSFFYYGLVGWIMFIVWVYGSISEKNDD